MHRLGIAELHERARSRQRDLALALNCARVVEPRSKLATTRTSGESTLSSMFSVEDATVQKVHSALDWLDGAGRPVAVEAVPGNTGALSTVAAQVEKIKGRFHLQGVVLVGDRGMLSGADLRPARSGR